MPALCRYRGLSRVLADEGRRSGLLAPFEWRLAHQRSAAEHRALRDDQFWQVISPSTRASGPSSTLSSATMLPLTVARAATLWGMDVPLHQALRGQGHVSRSGEVALEQGDPSPQDAPTPHRHRAGARGQVIMLIDGLDVRVISEDGEMLRHLTLDPTRDYQRR